MTKQEYLEQISEKKADTAKVKKMEDIYGAALPGLVRKIVSNNDETIFFDDGVRILSFDEIVDAESDLHVDFKAKGIIPIADCGENDFIVYHLNDSIWSKFNIIDETIFKKKNELSDLLK